MGRRPATAPAAALLAAALLALLLAQSGAAAALPRTYSTSWKGKSPEEKLALARGYYGNVSVAAALRNGTLWVESAFPLWPAALTETPEACRSGQALDVLFAVNSAPPRGANRLAARATWGDTRLLQRATGASSALLFFMGTSSVHVQALELEQRLRGDLVIADFVDSYRRARTAVPRLASPPDPRSPPLLTVC
jgi:hypothetical protein